MKVLKFVTCLSLFILLFALSNCKTTTIDPEVNVTPIDSIKQAVLSAAGTGDKDFEVVGYYWNSPVPMIITDLSLLDINAEIPDSKFLQLSGPLIKLLDGKPEFIGAKVVVKGKASFTRIPDTKSYIVELRCPELPLLVQARRPEIVLPVLQIDLCTRFPSICTGIVATIPNKYALLYSGGINQGNAHIRYWNDIKLAYKTLIKYGYSASNITVVYKGGVGEDSEIPVNFAATTEGLNNATNRLRNQVRSGQDDLFLFVTNHGGGMHRGSGHQGVATTRNVGGVTDSNNDELDGNDEAIYYYNNPGSDNILIDDVFASSIKSIPYRRLVGLLEPCFSGGLLRDLRGNNVTLASASSEDQYSYGFANGIFDVFVFYFLEGLNKADLNTGGAINVDLNGDGRVSFYEAFSYARSKDTAPETPLLEANGDGTGTAQPTATIGDGLSANAVFF